MSDAERQLVRRMHFDQKQKPTDIAAATGRDLSTVCRALMKKTYGQRKPGPKKMLTEVQVDKLQAKLEAMIAKADGCKEVTVPILKRAARCKAGEKTILRALHSRTGYGPDIDRI